DSNASVEGLQKKIRESSTDVITRKMQAEYIRSRNRIRMLIATACVLVAGFLIIAVRVVSENLQESRRDKPVVITEDSNVHVENDSAEKETDGQSGSEALSSEDMEAYRDMLYESINRDRQAAGGTEAALEPAFERAANSCIESCVNITASSQSEWSSKMTEAGTNALAQENIVGAGWWLQAYSSDMSIDGVKSDLYEYVESQNSGIENAIDLMNCTQIGISVGVHPDGTYFWVVIYR
ncbi:MAG: hypothetical protein J5962_04215, partial [Lachnospiraceae bacterium]|nr:hypothetical protein [Lachnospiraceae bacterium]